MRPETIEAYQQAAVRWATGGFEIMLTHNPLQSAPQADHRPADHVPGHGHPLPGRHCTRALAAGAAAGDLFDLRPVNLSIDVTTWLLFYAGFYLMQILLAFYTLGSFRWEALMLAAVSFPIYVQALINAFAGKQQRWHVTGGASKTLITVQLR